MGRRSRARGPARGGRQIGRQAGDMAKVRREIGETNGVRKGWGRPQVQGLQGGEKSEN